MNSVFVRDVRLGDDGPKICVPFTSQDERGLIAECAGLAEETFDMVEWRADFYEGITAPGEVCRVLGILREYLSCPILFTFRTEPNKENVPDDVYTSVCLEACASGNADLLDAELSRGEAVLAPILEAARRNHVYTVISCHNFESTPSEEELVASMVRMQELGCDIAKYAVMPQSPRDVMNLLSATLTMTEKHSETPVITMSMGKTGVISRLTGSVFGSCITFGMVGRASAPGQINATKLGEILDILKA